ncbi:helix-turn-helix domain-containing protein [Anaeromicrobium sediminis]|uniref:Resolvase HTH domain-containing protein n=1 Tax=Anaeromicrobium sediminis TaxID=1478221 RepID=A0A267MR01_9FIRM|nr:helix-turn-helix domain-containing protein [Anaeromicrobium sediminis]PAB61338.1 hypothetical protein CCE28_02590 [Anaeromicrobium sediminis]
MGVLYEIIKNAEVISVSGMGNKHRKWTNKDLDELGKLYLSGMSISKLARKYKVSTTTINKRLKEIGLRK